MKKKLCISVIVLFAVIVFSKFYVVNAADTVELTTALLEEAKGNPDTSINGVTYKYDDDMFYSYVYSLAPGNYKLGENMGTSMDMIHLFLDNGDFTFDSNENTLIGDIITRNSTLTFDGEGTIEYGLRAFDDADVTIKKGNFKGTLIADSSKMLIEYANVHTEHNPAIEVGNDIDLEIVDGIFTTNAQYAPAFRIEALDIKSVAIKGGIFTGGEYGLRSDAVNFEKMVLTGGTYKGTEAAIMLYSLSEEEAKKDMMNIVANGYIYSPSIEIGIEDFFDGMDTYYIGSSDLKETSVVPIKYSVTFNANGGTGEMSNVADLTGTYTLPENEFKAPAGKQFKGWSLTADGDVITTLEMSENTVLYAIWEDISSQTNNSTEENAEPENTVIENGGSVKPEETNNLAEAETPTEEDVVPEDENVSNNEKLDNAVSKNPKTGDNIALWISLLLISAGVIVEIKKINKK